MKIAQISPYDFAYHGGVQTHIANLAFELKRRGNEITILAPCSKSQPVTSVEGSDFISFGRSIPIPVGGSIARISPLIWGDRKLKTILEQRNFDIIHIHEPFVPAISFMALNMAKAPVVGTFHSYNDSKTSGYNFLKPFLLKSFGNMAAKIAVSEPAKNYISKFFAGKYHVIPNGVDTKFFSKSRAYPSFFDRKSVNLLFVGRINESRKGLRWLIGAYSILKWRNSNIKLVVVGGGVPDGETYRIMGERCLDDIVFTGPVSDDELASYYQHADVFCAPNTGKESFGFIIIESMASSTPIVASDIPGFNSVMENNVQGLLVQQKNEIALANAINKMIEDPAMRIRFGINGRNTARLYSWDKVADRILGVYESSLMLDKTRTFDSKVY